MASTLVIPCLYNSFSFTSENLSESILYYDCFSSPAPRPLPPPHSPATVPITVSPVKLPESEPDTEPETDDTRSTQSDDHTTSIFSPEVMHSYIVSLHRDTKDSLLWAAFIMVYGIEKYEIIENHYTESNTFKFYLVELMRENKTILKANKIKLNALEDSLVHKPFIGLDTIHAIALCKNLSLCIVQDRKYYETIGGEGCQQFIIEKVKGKYLLYMSPEKITNEYVKYIRKNYWLMENISAPIRSLSAYKLQDLVDICNKLNLPVVHIIPGKFGSVGSEKRKTKPELYESICKCL